MKNIMKSLSFLVVIGALAVPALALAEDPKPPTETPSGHHAKAKDPAAKKTAKKAKEAPKPEADKAPQK